MLNLASKKVVLTTGSSLTANAIAYILTPLSWLEHFQVAVFVYSSRHIHSVKIERPSQDGYPP